MVFPALHKSTMLKHPTSAPPPFLKGICSTIFQIGYAYVCMRCRRSQLRRFVGMSVSASPPPRFPGGPAPILLMRTLLQCLTLFPKLADLVSRYLSQLIQKNIWENDVLWKGFRKCVMDYPPGPASLRPPPPGSIGGGVHGAPGPTVPEGHLPPSRIPSFFCGPVM